MPKRKGHLSGGALFVFLICYAARSCSGTRMHTWLMLLGGALFILVLFLLILAWRSLDAGPPMG